MSAVDLGGRNPIFLQANFFKAMMIPNLALKLLKMNLQHKIGDSSKKKLQQFMNERRQFFLISLQSYWSSNSTRLIELAFLVGL